MEALLRQGLAAMGLPETAAPALADYAGRLLRQNEVMNLTAITDPADVAHLHLLDSAAVARHVPLAGKRVVDVGTGAGLPGMVLRILDPDFDLTLLDSLGKRVDWLASVCRDMGLSRVDSVHARAEEFAGDHRESYDVAVSRAVAQLNVLCELMLPLVKVGGVMVAMKSVGSDEEIAAARGAVGQLGGKVRSCVDYTIPGTDVTHRLVVIDKVRPTPPQFPRAFAKIKKQPLK
ncbi:MAG: 16S rRNA (guanine(527)-N(7))-methyltransferase RsmG [Oscillospiraceae bacterium]|nr:16S rRNA (guanine(527)-N(7))-methyltransferase RsmG [Oscillospiraceae bacterium]